MTLVSGTRLGPYEILAPLGAGALPARQAIEIATRVAQGLAAAYDKGIGHRDLRPENRFLTTGDLARILDFGLARIERPELSTARLDAARDLGRDTGDSSSPRRARRAPCP